MDAPTAEHLLTVAVEAGKASRGPEPKAALDQLESDYDELVAALQWFIEHERTDDARRMANALYRFWITKQRFEEGALWFDRALAVSGGDDHLRGQTLVNAGFHAVLDGPGRPRR